MASISLKNDIILDVFFNFTDTYESMENKKLASSAGACMAIIRSIEDIVCVDGLYYSTAVKSEHIRRLILNQRSLRSGRFQ